MQGTGKTEAADHERGRTEGPHDLTPEEGAALRLAKEFSAQVHRERETVQRLGEYLLTQQQTPERLTSGAPAGATTARLPSLHVRSWTAGASTHVQPLGELEAANCAQLEQVLRDVQPATGELVLDVSEVPLLDSAALSALLRVRRRLTAEGLRFRLTGARPAVQRVLVITGLHQLLSGTDDAGPAEP